MSTSTALLSTSTKRQFRDGQVVSVVRMQCFDFPASARASARARARNERDGMTGHRKISLAEKFPRIGVATRCGNPWRLNLSDVRCFTAIHFSVHKIFLPKSLSRARTAVLPSFHDEARPMLFYSPFAPSGMQCFDAVFVLTRKPAGGRFTPGTLSIPRMIIRIQTIAPVYLNE